MEGSPHDEEAIKIAEQYYERGGIRGLVVIERFGGETFRYTLEVDDRVASRSRVYSEMLSALEGRWHALHSVPGELLSAGAPASREDICRDRGRERRAR